MQQAGQTWLRCSKAVWCPSITWNVPLDAIAGTYRIRHRGAWKNGIGGAIAPYEGTTRTFVVQ
jgi:neutral ceramidase